MCRLVLSATALATMLIAPAEDNPPGANGPDQEQKQQAPDELAKKELEKLEGTWIKDSWEYKGAPQIGARAGHYVFKGDKFTYFEDDKEYHKGTIKVDPGKHFIDLVITDGADKGTSMLGLYELKEDTLKICFGPGGKTRPKELKTAADSDTKVWTYKRKKTGA
jgi:uncharacterized protein (TIGR03067 family)